jgi:hypothetical protein
MKARTVLVFAAGVWIGAVPVSAQIAPGAPGSNEAIPERDLSRPEDNRLKEPSKPQKDGVTTGRSLSDQLDESSGVIRPPKQIDPEFVEPAPDIGRTPVITPPGIPGGPPGPEPK